MATAISKTAFAAAMARFAPFENNPVIAVALSGGADSLCLASLVQNWCEDRHGKAIALIVDHQLRDESATEARTAANMARKLGMDAHILTWPDGQMARQKSGKQANARQARYALMSKYCQQHNVLHLATGHHFDDQQETRQMQHDRGTQQTSGMYAEWFGLEEHCPDIRLIRPLLGFRRQDTETTCQKAGLSWINDPSNQQTTYERGRLRQQPLSLLLEQAEDAPALNWLSAVEISSIGTASFPIDLCHDIPPDAFVSGLSSLLRSLGNHIYPPRRSQVEKAVSALKNQQDHVLAHCRLLLRRRRLWICREETHALDGFILPNPAIGQYWSALGEAGRHQLRSTALPDHFREMPPAVMESLPCLKSNDSPVSLPGFDGQPGWSKKPDSVPPNVKFSPRYPASGTLAG